MALSLEGQCDAAQDNEASQNLALALSVVFGVYAFLAIGLNGVAILSSSHAPQSKDGTGEGSLVQVEHVVHAIRQ
jgi:hypothetical protein